MTQLGKELKAVAVVSRVVEALSHIGFAAMESRGSKPASLPGEEDLYTNFIPMLPLESVTAADLQKLLGRATRADGAITCDNEAIICHELTWFGLQIEIFLV